MLVMRWGSSSRRRGASRRSSSLDMRDSLLQQPPVAPRPDKKCPSWNCLKCTSSADRASERVYLPLWELSSTPRDKRRMGYDVIRPATTQKTASAREFLPAGVATSTPLRPKSFAAPTDSEHWLDPPVGQTPHHTAFAMDVMKHGRRRSKDGGGSRQTQLRSPMVQRPSTAKVTLQGWLFKQGSEGLMLWKRRWFVLSEYCLFYYKGPEEEKLLGSILLPSYKISPCAPDDRVFRKFSFKAEHHNMRTYFFAADSREMMVRWMNAMSLASILQTAVPSWEEPASSSRPSVSSVSQSADDSDSGFHGYRSPRVTTTPRQGGDGASAKDSIETNGWGPPNMQPLYANAPPKPKRLPQGDSPEPSPERPPHPQHTPRGGIYGVSPRQQQHPEGRTPDPYGRPIDYEDVYGRKGAWPPPPPQAYMNEPPAKLDNFKSSPQDNNNYSKPPPDVTKTYVKPPGPHRNQDAPSKQPPPPATLPKQAFRMSSPAPPPAVKPRPKPPAGHPPRPHSADFLEMDVRETPPSVVPRRERNGHPVERPKSSIDVHNDDYWSEESYARKMRQSLYMHAQTQSGRATPLQKHLHDNRVKPPSHSRSPAQHDGRPVEEQHAGSSRRHSEQMDRHGNQFMRSASARLPRHKSRAEAHEQAEAPGSEKKIQQREESMQRLLEWKQRMLQSPLTRKSSPRPHDNSMPHSPLSHLLLRTPDAPATPGSDAGSVTFRPRRQPTRGSNSSTSNRSRSQDPGRRSAPPIHRRNSYSSDDEDVQREARSNRRPRKSATTSSQQAGRADPVDTERRRVHTPLSGSAVLPSSPDYVNINAFGEKKQHRIPPDVHYAHDSYSGGKKSGDTLTRYGPLQPTPKQEQPPAIPAHLHPAIGKTTPNTASIQRLIPVEDRNGKHSDSGYDSLRMQSAAAEIKRTVPPPKSGALNQPTDESQLIKEFSYQYIHSIAQELPPPLKAKSSLEERSSSRVKFQETPSRYETSEHLNKSSSPDANEEEEISSLRKARQSSLRSFALGEVTAELENAQRNPQSPKKNTSGSSNNSKTVRDLLADFERKSAALAKEQESINAKEARRCVFSDTETLLYDTSSDAEINYVDESKLRKNVNEMKQQRRCVSRAGERSDDDDEEIAAALGIKDSFISSGRELHAKRKELQNKKRKQPAKKLQMEDLAAPGYTRLSLAESMVAHEDSASSRSSPSPNPPAVDRMKTPEISVAAAEEHYLPMTPSKKSILEPNIPVLQLEECSYVEMGDDGKVQSLTSIFERTEQVADQRLFELQQKKTVDDEDSHYEFLYKATTKYEPVYMEVPPIDPLKPLSLSLPRVDCLPIEHSKTSSTSSSSRTVVYNENASDSLRALPDILNSTSSQKDKSDSDDADDEASKDLEMLDTPHHPRFSLSDTFRPASYYLGVGSRGNDPHDSSDSDLVSPPPIPVTLPPLDDDDEDFSLDLSRHSHGSQEARKWSDEASFRLRSAPGRSSMDGSDADRMKRRPVSEELLDSFEDSSFLTDYTKYGISESAYHKEIVSQEENMYATNKPLPKDIKSDLLFMERFPPSQSANASMVETENQNSPRSHGDVSPSKNEAIGGAPYYYSDLLKVMDEETNSMYDRFQQHAVNQLRTSLRLNNQRNDGIEGKRSDIGRHVNPIPLLNGILDLNDPNLIAEEIRNTTAGLVSKSVPVDERNFYEADTLRKMAQKRHLQRRRSKTPDPDIASRNLYPAGLRDKFDSSFEARRRSRSLEGLVDVEEGLQQPMELDAPNEGADPWEEDTLWRESLRRVSIRHTRSLDDLDESDPPTTPAPAPSGRRSVDHLAGTQQRSAKVTRDVTYVNDVSVRPRMIRSKELYESDYREGRRSGSRQNHVPPPPPPEEDSGVYERLLPTESMERNRRGQTFVDRYEFDVDSEMFRQPSQNGSQQPHFLEESLPPSFEIDREKLRQWDLLSSAPLEDGANPAVAAPARVHPAEGDPADPNSGPQSPQSIRQGGGRQPTATTKQPITKSKVQSDQQSLGGSGSGSIQESIPAVRSHHRQQQRPSPMTVQPAAVMSQEDMGGGGHAAFKAGASLGSRGASPKLNSAARSPLPPGLLGPDEGNNISDSELARRPARLAELDAARRAEHLRRLEDLKRHLQEIEKQYEKGKPLVNLVDNMVKLGSMYRGSSINSLPRSAAITPPPMQRFEFNMHEQRLMVEDRREWNRLSPPEHAELQAKMQQLYHMERQLQEQTLILQNLQQDKTLLQRALGGLRHKLATSSGAEAERFHHQQRLLEREFSRVRHLLAIHSKKMEDIVVDNARVEHDIMMLRQKAENQRMMSRSATPTMMVQGSSAVDLELELRRVQNLVGDLQRQRHDLSVQVKQLTEKRHSLTLTPELRGKLRSSTSPALSPSSLPSTPRQRRPSSSWLETDLDSMHTIDRAIMIESPLSPLMDPRAPLYVNTETLEYSMNGKGSLTPDDLSPPPPPAPEDPSLYNGSATTYYEPQDISEADDRMKRFYGIIPKTEKAEIKTVRIVKRESERRNRVKQRPSMDMDLSRVTEEDHPPPPSELELSLLMELQAQQEQQAAEAHIFQRSMSLPRGFGKPQPPPPPSRALSPRSDNGSLRTYRNMSPQGERPLSAHAQLFGSTDQESPRLVDEGVCEGSSSSGPVSPVYQSEAARAIVQEMTRRRTVPKTKRRHHTVTGGGQQTKAEANMGAGARARDDLDMERALRRRVAGAPDVVRSTLSQRELKYNETTIDSILGTPNKIVIPERYVPEKEPEMSAEEQLQRLRKAESIRKMLSETTPLTSENQAQSPNNDGSGEEVNSTMKLKLAAEKKQREHLLQLNQILAQQVMEKSKMVAGSSQGNGRM